jgi:RluA family pseudouridine synthase
VHRLDGDTTGVLLFARSMGAVNTYSELFESRRMTKSYLAVVHGQPRRSEWSCEARLAPDPAKIGRMRVDPREGKDAKTHFRVLKTTSSCSLVEARPVTGRTHQIRLHLQQAGHPVLGDDVYGPATGPGSVRAPESDQFPLALRAASLSYSDPFQRRLVTIEAPAGEFLKTFGFAGSRPSETKPVPSGPVRQP